MFHFNLNEAPNSVKIVFVGDRDAIRKNLKSLFGLHADLSETFQRKQLPGKQYHIADSIAVHQETNAYKILLAATRGVLFFNAAHEQVDLVIRCAPKGCRFEIVKPQKSLEFYLNKVGMTEKEIYDFVCTRMKLFFHACNKRDASVFPEMEIFPQDVKFYIAKQLMTFFPIKRIPMEVEYTKSLDFTL